MSSTPDVPLRLERTFELPGTGQQVWDAIATAKGLSSWFLPTDLEERQGGAIVTHMGEDESSAGTVVRWEPTTRFAYEEPDWAAMMGHAGAAVTPLVSEFLIEARSGGTCVLRVVSSAFGTGADWEQESFTEMEAYWMPFFDNLRLYLAHFPGQHGTPMEAGAEVAGDVGTVWQVLRQAVGADQEGDAVEVRGLVGTVERIAEAPAPRELLVRVTGPLPGLFGFNAREGADGMTYTSVQGWLFSEEARVYVEREQPQWKAWLQNLTVPAV